MRSDLFTNESGSAIAFGDMLPFKDSEESYCQFSIDDSNMITCPLTFYDRSGYLRRANSFICSYIYNNKWVRFPANLPNLEMLDSWGISKSHSSGKKGKLFAELCLIRQISLALRQSHFRDAEDVKNNQGRRNITLGEAIIGSYEEFTEVEAHTCKGRSFYFQQRVGAVLAAQYNVLLAMQQRTGKTPTVLAAIKEMMATGDYDAVMLCAPKSLLNTAWQFDRELYLPGMRSCVMLNDAARAEAVEYDVSFFLSTFESAAKNWSIVTRLYDPERVILVGDESIKIKTPTAKRTLGFMSAAKQAGRVILLSGQPASKLYEDIWAQAYCIDPGILGDRQDAFVHSFITVDEYGRQSFKKGKRKLYYELQDCFAFRCTRGEAEQFKGRDTYTINVKLKASRIQAHVYKQMLEAYCAYLETEEATMETEATNVLVQLLRLREILSGFFSYESEPVVFEKVRIPDNPKAQWLSDYVDEHPGTQFIVFCEFNEGEQIVLDTLDKLGVSHGGHASVRRRGIRGAAAQDAFSDDVRDFQDGKITAFVGKHSAIGHGLTLSAADAAIFWNMGFNSDNYDQARDRPVAGGKCALIYHLMVSGSIETTKIYPTLSRRGDMKAELMRDIKRKGFYSFFEEISKDQIEIAAETSYDDDPLEREARAVTKYDGPLSEAAINMWLHGTNNPVVEALEKIRSVGSVSNAYKRIAARYHPDRNMGDATANEICKLAIVAMKEKPSWNGFLDSVKEKLGISKKLVNRSPKFDLMLAYLRMKGANN